MTSVMCSELRRRQSGHVTSVRREPVKIISGDGDRRAVIVSREFLDRALAAFEEIDDIRAAAAARREMSRLSHDALTAELGREQYGGG